MQALVRFFGFLRLFVCVFARAATTADIARERVAPCFQRFDADLQFFPFLFERGILRADFLAAPREVGGDGGKIFSQFFGIKHRRAARR